MSSQTNALRERLLALAERYETAAFLRDDPAQFMHRYDDAVAQERAAFIASALSYGSRALFLPKIDLLLNTYLTHRTLLPDNDECFYRLHTNRMVNRFLTVLETIYDDYGSMREWVRVSDVHTGLDALRLITHYFSAHHASDLIPKDLTSACKRVCMFLRWMVRTPSPVDLGLWSALIDKATLIIPLDTHVLHTAQELGLIKSRSASMATAQHLTQQLREFFPDDPVRADFALFGLGVERMQK